MGTKISELPWGNQMNGFEFVPIVQSGETKILDIRSINKKSFFEINLLTQDFTIDTSSQYGNYFVSIATPHKIILPSPTESDGYEIIICNYDQDNDAEFFGDYIPFIQSSTQSGQEYLKIPKRQTIKLVAINNKWNACIFASDVDEYKVFNAIITYDALDNTFYQTVFKNTIGDITLNYLNPGQYLIYNSASLFTPGKTQIFIGQNNNNGYGGEGNFVFYTCNQQNSSSIYLNVYDVNVGGNDVYSSDLMTELSIEIKVYP